jgi:hypothetical protein
MMRNQGLDVHALAVPFGDAGSDPELHAILAGLLTRQFGTYFVAADADGTDFNTPGRGAAERFPVHADTTLDDLYAWLNAGTEKLS